jgi:hypothetical protein
LRLLLFWFREMPSGSAAGRLLHIVAGLILVASKGSASVDPASFDRLDCRRSVHQRRRMIERASVLSPLPGLHGSRLGHGRWRQRRAGRRDARQAAAGRRTGARIRRNDG